ncbi:isochorismatase [Diplocarpon rosae]|nr:isochorismatase [Diplocarpon rosae]
MFETDANNLPFVRTRQALLLLDLQNDFVSPDATLPVKQPPDFLDKIVELVPEFRASGNIIWIRTCFEASRKVNEPYGDSEKVITELELNPDRLAESESRNPPEISKMRGESGEKSQGNEAEEESSPLIALDEDEDSMSEAYLSIEPGQEPKICLPTSPKTNFCDNILSQFNSKQDLVVQKTYYSAFKDGTLVQILRAKFVTEIYICGALTNISVFATAMDAARHGYGITVIEDCLGYRSKARHDEALRRLVEYTGCEIMTSEELQEELREKARRLQAPVRSQPRSRPDGPKIGLEDLMSSLNLRQDRPSSSRRAGPKSAGSRAAVVTSGSTGGSPRAEENESEGTQGRLRPGGDSHRREKVKSKIKIRRRPSNPTKPDAASGSSENIRLSSTTATLQAASQALDKLAKPVAGATAGMFVSSRSEAPGAPDSNIKPEADMVKSIFPTATIAAHSDYVAEEQESSSDDRPSVLCEGDTTIIRNLLRDDLAECMFRSIRDEVRWQKMSHQGGEVPRLVAVQGEVARDGCIPIYRHPADESPPLLPFSENVSLIKKQVEKHLGHTVNHVLIQFYRDGTDYISEHSDKTLDIVPGTCIANVSLGAQRTMIFRTKRQTTTETGAAEPRKTCRASLPHNSMCKVGLVTNMRWLHGIRQDKRMASEKVAEELAYQGGRISLTFRKIGTFLDKNQQKIWGQGATAKTREQAKTVINGHTPDAERMIRAFAEENQSAEFDWKATYGAGFDVLHMSNARKLFLSGDPTADLRVQLYLAEHRIGWTEGKLSPPFTWKDGSASTAAPEVPESLPIKFVDNDLSRSTVVGDLAIMLYLDAVYGAESPIPPPTSGVDLARQYTRLQQSSELLKRWRTEPFSVKPFQQELKVWEVYALEAPYMGGDRPTLADFALFPVVDEIRSEWKNADGVHNLVAWYLRMRYRETALGILGPLDKVDLLKEESLIGHPDIKVWD